MERRRALLAMAAAFAGLLPSAALAEGTVKIGLVTTLTTPSAVIGRDVIDAVNLAIEHVGGTIAGRRIDLVIEDDAAKPELGRQKIEKLIHQDNVDLLSGINWSNVLLASRKSIADSGKLFISVNAGPSEIAGRLCHENILSLRGQNDLVPMALGKIMNTRGVKKLYALAANFAAGRDMVAGVERTFKGDVVGRDFTKWGDDPQIDFSAELAKAKASSADAVFAFFPGRTAPAFARQFDQAGLAGQLKLYTVYTLDQLALQPLQKVGAKGIVGSETADNWSPDLDNPANRRFVSDFKAKYGRIPSTYAAVAYDLVPAVKAAVEQSGGDVGQTAKVRQALREAHYASVRGAYSYGRNNFPVGPYYNLEVAPDPSGDWTLKRTGQSLDGLEDPYIKDCHLKF